MTGHPFRIFLMLAFVVTGLGVGQAYQVFPSSAVAAFVDSKDKDHAQDCADANPDWVGLAVAVNTDIEPMEIGRVYSADDGTLAVLTIVTDVDDDGDTQGIDFTASLSVSAVIIRGYDHNTTIEFDPPTRSGSGLAADNLRAIDAVVYCYQARLPKPPATSTAAATETSTTSRSATPVATEPATATATAAASESAVASPIASVESTMSPEVIATGTATAPPAETATSEPTATVVPSATATEAPTQTVEPSATATEAPTQTVEPSATATEVPTQTVEPSATATEAPTQTVEPSATSVPTEPSSPEATVAPSETTAPTETVAAVPTPVLLYGVPESEGFDTWSVPGGWTVANGVLTSDGGDFQGYAQPTRSIDQPDYAVEIEFRVVEQPANCGGNLGLVMRGGETGFYAGGIEWVCNSGPTVRLWAYNTVLKEQAIAVDQEWITLRVEAKGDLIRLSVNGTLIAEVTDSTFPTGGQIAVWSNRVKVEVRAVRVFAAA